MTLSSNYGADSNNDDIVSIINKRYQKDIYLQQQFWVQADIDLKFKVGDQSLERDYYNVTTRRNSLPFTFNKIRRIVNMICGHQRKNRKSLSIVPQENNDDETADQLSGLLQWVMTKAEGYNKISAAFEGAVTTGFSLISPYMDYSEDPISGDIKIAVLDANSFMIDPNFKEPDLSDAAYIWTRRFVNKQQAKQIFPDKEQEIDDMLFTKNHDEKFSFIQENKMFNQSDTAPLDWYWYKDTRKAIFLHDEETGECVEWSGEEEDLEMFLEMHGHLAAIEVQKPTVKLAGLLSGTLMYHGPNPWEIDDYPFVGVFGYFEPHSPDYWWKIQGVVRGLRDAQFLYNRRQRISLDILESQINSGLKVKEDALVDGQDAFMTGQGRVLFIKKTADITDVQTIEPPKIDQSMLALQEGLSTEIMEISGVNEELLGSADDDKAGVLSMLRQGAGLTTLQTLFDQLDLSCKQLGGLIVSMIQANFSSGKVKRILGEEPSLRFKDKAFRKYDCHVEEGVLTSTQKQMQFAQLMKLKELGIEIPDSVIIDAATLQNKKDLMDTLEAQNQQAQEMQQMQEQQQMQSQQVLSETLLAKAHSDNALAAERMNKIQLDEALSLERIANAQSDRDAATLSRVKAAKELTEIDLNQLAKVIGIIKMLQEQQNEEANLRAQNQKDSQLQTQAPGQIQGFGQIGENPQGASQEAI
jgi:hypothetical protein